MTNRESEVHDGYKRGLAHLAEFLEAREGYRKTIREA